MTQLFTLLPTRRKPDALTPAFRPQTPTTPSATAPDSFQRSRQPQFGGACGSKQVEPASPQDFVNAAYNHLSVPQVRKMLKDNPDIDINASDANDRTATLIATMLGAQPLLEFLVDDQGADVSRADKDGNFPLAEAAKTDRTALARIILEGRNADINQKDNLGRTALMRAASLGKAKMVRFLLQSGADHRETDDQRQTALALAKHHKALAISSPNFTTRQKDNFRRQYNEIIVLLQSAGQAQSQLSANGSVDEKKEP